MADKNEYKNKLTNENGPASDPAPVPVVSDSDAVSELEIQPDTPPQAAADGVAVPEDDAARLRDQLLRLQADFDNYRKRVIRDDSNRARRATEKLIGNLLPVLDHFEMGLKAAQSHLPTAVYDGLALVQTQLLDVLKKPIVPVVATGAVFDPQCHECIAHLPSQDFAEGMVMDVNRNGYWLGDYLLRPAQVVVSSGMPETETDLEDDAGESQDASD